MKNFNDIYEKVLKENKSELEMWRKKSLGRVAIVIILVLISLGILCTFDGNFFTSMILFASDVVAIFFLLKPLKQYTALYKEKVVKVFIKEYDENLEYSPERGIDSREYDLARFERYDKYYSEDLIQGVIDGHRITMAEVHTEDEQETTDSDGNSSTTYVTLFHGMFGICDFENNYNGLIKVRSDKKIFGKFFKGKNKVEMDSVEFEKYFDVYADDKIQTMQLLTSDIMDMMLEFCKKSKIKFECTITANKLYIRYFTGEMFEANILKSSVNFDTLKKIFDIVNFTFDIAKAMTKASEDVEI